MDWSTIKERASSDSGIPGINEVSHLGAYSIERQNRIRVYADALSCEVLAGCLVPI
jgi:hypothetical protein